MRVSRDFNALCSDTVHRRAYSLPWFFDANKVLFAVYLSAQKARFCSTVTKDILLPGLKVADNIISK